ncbi:uncharacterized protein LOC132279180 [Cornus florida]|uniref:uncharacterized protein LOC132279180 n=1 Tax=Cornus florida TaxID=4283 RepID=UPI0028A26AB9|nr:uncharacterized protein LOC132279180 [Cornus florida]
MATGAAAGDGLFRGGFEGCLSGSDMGIQRRPYHRNCSCALHKSRGHCSHGSRLANIVKYPIRRSWSEGCLALMAANSGHSSPCSSPSMAAAEAGKTQKVVCNEEEEEEFIASCMYKV